MKAKHGWEWLWPAVSAALLVLGGCSMVPGLGTPKLPAGANPAPSLHYADLSAIPAKPSTSPEAERKEAEKSLAQDRASTAQAADELRHAPFDVPDPPPAMPGP
jgi:hypothetical protein